MNERIRELAMQAANGMLSYDAEGDFRLSEKEVEKFAELIVKECADVAFKNVCYGNGEVGPESDILDHFGVKR